MALLQRWAFFDRPESQGRVRMTVEDQEAWVSPPHNRLRFRDLFAYHEADQRDAALMYTAGHWRKGGFTMPLQLNGEYERHIQCGGAVGLYLR